MKEDELIFCPRCGEKMRKGQRNCLKCGQLNYENPSNEYMKKYESKHGSNLNDGTYIIGKGTVRKPSKLSIFSNSRPNEILANNAGNLTFCALFNIFIYVMVIVIFFLINLKIKGNILSVLLDYQFIYFLLIYSISFIFMYSLELLFMKADKKWWKALIPFYNLYLFCKIVMGSGLFFILFFIPIVGIIMYMVLFYNVGKVYGKRPWFTLLVGIFALPILAFSSTTSYNGVVYVNKVQDKSPMEVLYKFNRVILTLFFLFIIMAALLMAYNKREWFFNKYQQIKTWSFIRDVKAIVKDASDSIKEDNYECSNGISLELQTEYYITFDNAGSYFNSVRVSTSSLSDGYYRGYIRVVNYAGDLEYYISVDDTLYGIDEVNSSELNKVYPKKNFNVELPKDGVICRK